MKLVPVPDSVRSQGATEYLAAHADDWLIAHSHRTFQWGSALLGRIGVAPDPELLFVASMRHDLALGTDLDLADVEFQNNSAALARGFMIDNGANEADADRVQAAIALHLDLSSAEDARPEVAGVHVGAAFDVLGLRIEDLDPSFVENVLAAHQRNGMKCALRDVMESEARLKPSSAVAVLVEHFGLLDLITNAPFES